MALTLFASGAVAWWANYYESHHVVSVTIRFLHLAGLLIGGGTAIATDRQLLRAVTGGGEQRTIALGILRQSHRIVVPAVSLVVLSGLLMTAADSATFFASRIYWVKIALIGLLLANGTGLLAAEAAVAKSAGTKGWTRLAAGSLASVMLWLLILLMGTWLTVAA
jgi:hypothetical protein